MPAFQSLLSRQLLQTWLKFSLLGFVNPSSLFFRDSINRDHTMNIQIFQLFIDNVFFFFSICPRISIWNIQIVFPYLYALQMQAAKIIYFPRTFSRQNIAEQSLPKKYLISSSCVTICLGFCAKVFCQLTISMHSAYSIKCLFSSNWQC